MKLSRAMKICDTAGVVHVAIEKPSTAFFGTTACERVWHWSTRFEGALLGVYSMKEVTCLYCYAAITNGG